MKQKFIDAANKVIKKNRKAVAIRAIRRAEEGLEEAEKTRFSFDPDVLLPQDTKWRRDEYFKRGGRQGSNWICFVFSFSL